MIWWIIIIRIMIKATKNYSTLLLQKLAWFNYTFIVLVQFENGRDFWGLPCTRKISRIHFLQKSSLKSSYRNIAKNLADVYQNPHRLWKFVHQLVAIPADKIQSVITKKSRLLIITTSI